MHFFIVIKIHLRCLVCESFFPFLKKYVGVYTLIVVGGKQNYDKQLHLKVL